MKKTCFIFGVLLSLIVASCTSDELNVADEVGYLCLEMNTVSSTVTRGEVVNAPEGYAPKQLYVEIVNAAGVVVESTNDFFNDENWHGEGKSIALKVGTYTINAHSYGWDASGSGMDTPYYYGTTTHTVKKNEIKKATVKCTQANVKVSVEFDQSFIDNFKEATSTIASALSEEITPQIFTMGETAGLCTGSAYFPVGNLTSKIAVVNNFDKAFEQENTIGGDTVRARDHYIIKYAVASGTASGVSVVINDDYRTLTYVIDVFYPSNIAIDCSVVPSFTSAQMTGEIKVAEGKTVDKTQVKIQYKEKNATAWTIVDGTSYTNDAGKISYTLEGLTPSTEYQCQINYHDAEDGDVPGNVVDFTTTDFFSNLSAESNLSFSATLTGIIGDANEAANISLQWQKNEDNATWTTVGNSDLTINGTNVSYNLVGLNTIDDYKFRLVCNSLNIESTSKNFKTKGTKLQNGGFENWNKNGKVWFPNEAGVSYWDSSNPGSAGAMGENANVTTKTTDNVHSGNSAARLRSDYFVIKFAAASLYTGSFVGLVQTVGANLNWGVPFSDMPTALKGFRIAQPATVNRTGSGMPSGYPLNGQTDHQQIYCALLTEQLHVHNLTKESDRASNASEIVGYELCTAIDWANDPRVIAYGEITMKGSDNGWTEFNIPLEYHGTPRQPAYLLILASSSKYGDYFHGGDGSTLYLDDLELVYDGNYTVKQ